MHKKITINNTELFLVRHKEDIYTCTIENTRRDEYHVYTEKGKGISIAKLNTISIVELMATGSLEDGELVIVPIDLNS